MKAVILLLCLALPRDIVGNIFRRRNPPNNLVIQKVLYFDESGQQEDDGAYQNQVQQDARPQVYQQQNSQNTELQGSFWRDPRQMYNQKEQQLNQGADKQKMPEQFRATMYNKNEEQLNQDAYSNKMPSRFQAPMLSQEEQQQYQTSMKTKKSLNSQKNYKQQMAAQPNDKRTSFFTRESNSIENKQWAANYDAINENQQYLQSRFADIKPTYNLRAASKKNQMSGPVNADVVEWNDLRMKSGAYSPVQNKLDIQRIFEDSYDTMQPMDATNKMKFHAALESAAEANNEDARLNATGLIRKNKYPVEEHIVRTEDGFNLTIFRIIKEVTTDKPQQRPVVFLMHGLLGSADDWLLMGPTYSLAYLLADAGFDVWLGNSRGTKYSRHASKHPAQPDFWQYSVDEIALYDLPAMIDYALETSNQQKLYYVGHSQGNTVYFALASTRPEYNNKIAMMYAMSPMVHMNNVRSPLLRMIAPDSPFYENLNEQLGNGEFRPRKEVIHTVGGDMCLQKIGCKRVCSNMYLVMAGINADDVDMNTMQIVMGHLPAGASVRQMRQYGQAVATGELRRYDFGAVINQEVYGQVQAPKYEMKLVSAPVTLYYSEEDWLAHPMDVERLRSELPNVQESYKVPEPHFNHVDFQFSNKATKALYTRIIEGIQNNFSQ